MRALRADRLMTPAEDSAYHYFSRVLAFEPDNAVAHDGLRDIALRYVQLAGAASRQGQFDNAEAFLRRAEDVDDELPALAAARQTLATARAQTHSVHKLNNRELAQRQPAIVQKLEEIAGLVAASNTFVLITAPNDELGRWIYAQLQTSMAQARLRADIEIGEQASVRLVLPRTT
jgi:tetratricopeptide (TPR) repeat protein